MQLEESVARRSQAAAEFDRRENRRDGAGIVHSLADGLALLRDLLFTRVHDDVLMNFGADSMLMPTSAKRSESEAKAEIEVYQAVIAAGEAELRAYVGQSEEAFADWVGQLRLGEDFPASRLASRLHEYLPLRSEKRRMAFERVLAKTCPEIYKAPLVLFRLFPPAVRIVVATAFGDSLAASESRNVQTSILPQIGECHECHGRPLDNGEQCHVCGNPLWIYKWLTAD